MPIDFLDFLILASLVWTVVDITRKVRRGTIESRLKLKIDAFAIGAWVAAGVVVLTPVTWPLIPVLVLSVAIGVVTALVAYRWLRERVKVVEGPYQFPW